MSTAKFEKLIDLIINEDQERAEQLFHEIVVEKSREIYENIMAEDQTEGLIDEVSMEEEGMEGMMEDDDEFTDAEELDGDMDTDMADMDADEGDMADDEADMDMDMADMADDEEDMDAEEGDLEDRVVDLEDKLDELMAEFEAKMGSEEEAEGEEEEEEGEEEEEEGEEEEEESGLMENVTLSKVSVTHGDDGAQKKSPVPANAGAKGPVGSVVKPVKFSGEHETVPTAPKGPSNAYSKGEKMTGASYQNSPGGAKGVKDGKGEAAAKPVTKDAAAQKHSPVAESKRPVKRMVK